MQGVWNIDTSSSHTKNHKFRSQLQLCLNKIIKVQLLRINTFPWSSFPLNHSVLLILDITEVLTYIMGVDTFGRISLVFKTDRSLQYMPKVSDHLDIIIMGCRCMCCRTYILCCTNCKQVIALLVVEIKLYLEWNTRGIQ